MEPLDEVVRAAKEGDQQALERLVRGTYPPVQRFCAALVDEPSAEDLAQETFIRALRTLPAFRGESTIHTWLLSTARHVCLDELRRRARGRRRAGSGPPAWGPEFEADASQPTVVNDLVSRLEPERRSAFVLTQLLGLSYDEAAQVCECPTGTIRSRVARARSDLIQLLGAAESLRPDRSDAVPDRRRRA
jgi:RNA polymerase sigma-70 factor (ECF subfamily)